MYLKDTDKADVRDNGEVFASMDDIPDGKNSPVENEASTYN